MSASERMGSPVALRAVSRTERTIDIVASDFSEDSYGTRIDPNGWDLEQFRKNPVILLVHNDWSFPVATALPESIRVEKGELLMRIQFPKKGKYEQADIAFELYADGFMRGISVGFVPLSWEDKSEGEGDDNRTVRYYTKAKLLEVSLVAIPSNDNALAKRCSDLNHDLKVITERTVKLEHLLETTGTKADATEERTLNGVTIRVNVSDLEAFDEAAKELEKHSSYFERKQPANKASTKVLEKFFKAHGIEQPSDEVEAWKRMEEIIEEEERKEDEKEEVVEIPEQPTAEAPEAPEPERKAFVQVPLDRLVSFPERFTNACVEAVVEASRRGVPSSELTSLPEALGEQFIKTLSTPSNGSSN